MYHLLWPVWGKFRKQNIIKLSTWWGRVFYCCCWWRCKQMFTVNNGLVPPPSSPSHPGPRRSRFCSLSSDSPRSSGCGTGSSPVICCQSALSGLHHLPLLHILLPAPCSLLPSVNAVMLDGSIIDALERKWLDSLRCRAAGYECQKEGIRCMNGIQFGFSLKCFWKFQKINS